MTYIVMATTTERIREEYGMPFDVFTYRMRTRRLPHHEPVRPVRSLPGIVWSESSLECAFDDAFDMCIEERQEGHDSRPVVLVYKSWMERNKIDGGFPAEGIVTAGYHEIDRFAYMKDVLQERQEARREKREPARMPIPFSLLPPQPIRQVSIPA